MVGDTKYKLTCCLNLQYELTVWLNLLFIIQSGSSILTDIYGQLWCHCLPILNSTNLSAIENRIVHIMEYERMECRAAKKLLLETWNYFRMVLFHWSFHSISRISFQKRKTAPTLTKTLSTLNRTVKRHRRQRIDGFALCRW